MLDLTIWKQFLNDITFLRLLSSSLQIRASSWSGLSMHTEKWLRTFSLSSTEIKQRKILRKRPWIASIFDFIRKIVLSTSGSSFYFCISLCSGLLMLFVFNSVFRADWMTSSWTFECHRSWKEFLFISMTDTFWAVNMSALKSHRFNVRFMAYEADFHIKQKMVNYGYQDVD